MIIHFPTPYPDELLYSVFARYHIRSGNFFLKHTMEDLFGKRTATATAMLPSGIRLLVERLPENTTLNEQEIIEKHTMFPFYTAFLPGERAKKIYESMLCDSGGNIFMQSGLMASIIPQNKHFKYCPVCFKEDLKQYGELYWHRIHQLPGNLMCEKHGVWLEDSAVQIIQDNKHVYSVPSIRNCDLSKIRPVNDQQNKMFKRFLKDIEYLLVKSPDMYLSYEHFTSFYRKHLIEKGYASINGYVNQKKLHEDFIEYYSDDFLKNLHCIIPYNNYSSWLSNITRKHRKSFHPYHHILLLNFLQLDVQEVFQDTPSYQPFGSPNWPCLNIVCKHFKEDVIQKISIRSCEKTKKPIGRFTCPFCGFSYTRKGTDQTFEDRYKYTRIMELGPVWKEKLSFLLSKNLSYREIARRLKVDVNIVIKYSKVLNSSKMENSKEVFSIEKVEKINKQRNMWLQLQKDYPELSKTQLRKLKPATYSFLYRNDREWLHSNSPARVIKKVNNNRVDWNERDNEILLQVKAAYEKLKNNKEKAKRISVSSLGGSIGKRALFEKHLDKMPMTKKFIESVIESEQEFRKRRVKNVIKEMGRSGKEVKAWKVLRKAGIKTKFKKQVQNIINNY